MTSSFKKINLNDIRSEVKVITSRSGGKGGQHVNKVETKVQLLFNIQTSTFLTKSQKEILISSYKHKLTKEGNLIISCDKKRSQFQNKEIAFKKLEGLLVKAFVKGKIRLKTKPSKAAIRKRLQDKKALSEKKYMRKKNIDY